MNVIKKYNLKKLKKASGFKKADNILGDVYGVANGYLKECDKEGAFTALYSAAFTLDEITVFFEDLVKKYGPEDAAKIFVAELIKSRAIAYDMACKVEKG